MDHTGANKSIWQPGTAGAAVDSRFGHNFYGLYGYEASDLLIRGNEVHHSVRYGIDLHTRSNRILIANNISHHNGKQGIILAAECSDSTIAGSIIMQIAIWLAGDTGLCTDQR